MEDKIRQRAHALWEQEGRPDGRATDHWIRAQQEVQGASSDTTPTDDSEGGDPAAAAASAAVTGVDVGNASASTTDVERSMLTGDDAATPYLNAETGRADRS